MLKQLIKKSLILSEIPIYNCQCSKSLELFIDLQKRRTMSFMYGGYSMKNKFPGIDDYPFVMGIDIIFTF